MAVSTAFHGKFDRHSISPRTPLSRNFSRNVFCMFVDMLAFEVKILRPETSNSTSLIAPQNVLRCLPPGCMIAGEQRPNPSLSCLRFFPYNAQILLSRDWIEESPCTVSVGASALSPFRPLSSPFPFPFGPLAPFPFALFLGQLEFGSGFFPFSL